MIAAGSIKEKDRERCIFWADAKSGDFPPGHHEAQLKALGLVD